MILPLLFAVQCAWQAAADPVFGNDYQIEWRIARAAYSFPISPDAVGESAILTTNRTGQHKIQCLVRYLHQSEAFADGFESGDLSAWDGPAPLYFVQSINFVQCEGG